MRTAGYFAAIAAATAFAQTAQAQVPDYYPSSYSDVVAAARTEGKVVVYGTPDPYVSDPLVAAFQKLYPGVSVEFNMVSSVPMYSRIISEVAAKAASADVVWSPAMDLQTKLATDGVAVAYDTPEAKFVPDWASWNKQLYAVSIAPAIFVYNNKLLKPEAVPQSHADVARLLQENADVYRDKIIGYDPEKCGLGFLFLQQDQEKLGDKVWEIHKTLGSLGQRLSCATTDQMESVGSTENVFSYNLNGTYIGQAVADNPDIGYVLPSDYTLVYMDTMFISATAAHPNAAKLWLDFMLSSQGQSILRDVKFTPIRNDLNGPSTANDLIQRLGKAFSPIAMGPGLLEYLDPDKRAQILDTWKKAFSGG